MFCYHAAIVAFLMSLAVSSPTPIKRSAGSFEEHRLPHCRNRPWEYASVSTYDIQWFRANMLHKPSIDFTHTLFYTSGMTGSAKLYACSRGYTTIWDVWPSELYDSSAHPSNEFSCIHNDKASRQLFFKTMSQAFATLAMGEVLVMHNDLHYFTPPLDGIWAQIERETIIHRVAQVQTMMKMRRFDVRSIIGFWTRSEGYGSWPVQQSRVVYGVIRRRRADERADKMKKRGTNEWEISETEAHPESIMKRNENACSFVTYEFENEVDW